MRWIYLSPHMDDAALSAGGLIYEQARSGVPVEIWTLFCGFPPPYEPSAFTRFMQKMQGYGGGRAWRLLYGTPLPNESSYFAQMMHQLWGFASAEECVQKRREEDKRAAEVLGATARHFDFLDAIYRRGPHGEWLYPQEVFVKPHPSEAGLPEEIAEAVSMRLLPDDILVCQLGVGGHVDHRLARAAAERLGRPLWYDADLPYLFNHPGELEPFTAGLDESVQPVAEAALGPWEQAIRCHASQISTLFEGPEKIGELLRGYWEPKAGVSLWRAGDGLAHSTET